MTTPTPNAPSARRVRVSANGIWTGSAKGRTPAPSDHDALYREHRDYVRNLVAKTDIHPNNVEDVVQSIFLSFHTSKNEEGQDILGQYDPTKTFHGKQQTATFRTFMTNKVNLYIKGHLSSQATRQRREVFIAGSGQNADGAGDAWELQIEGPEIDTYTVEAESIATDLRAFLVEEQKKVELSKLSVKTGLPVKNPTTLDLPRLFDVINELLREHNWAEPKKVWTALGISDTTYYLHMKALRAATAAWQETQV